MENEALIIWLLTIAVFVLSVVVVALLTVVIAVLVKLKKIANRVDDITDNVAAASEWLVPSRVIGQFVKAFRK